VAYVDPVLSRDALIDLALVGWFVALAIAEAISARHGRTRESGDDGRLLTNFGLTALVILASGLLPLATIASAQVGVGIGMAHHLHLPWVPIFALTLQKDAGEALAGRDDVEPVDLRSIATRGLVPPGLLGSLGGAKAMLDWHNRHGFCANCGSRSVMNSAGWRRECPACSAQHFPRTDPVVIMLAIEGERCLMGRQTRFPPGMYSALAGFLEPGETAEDAVRREIHEEAGVRCTRVTYFASQPWPFPSSLMIGCFAQALSNEINVDHKELEDARWFSRDEIAAMFAGTHPHGLVAPQPVAIAHHLLKAFARKGAAVLE